MCAISSLTSTFAISSPDEFLFLFEIISLFVMCVTHGILLHVKSLIDRHMLQDKNDGKCVYFIDQLSSILDIIRCLWLHYMICQMTNSC